MQVIINLQFHLKPRKDLLLINFFVEISGLTSTKSKNHDIIIKNKNAGIWTHLDSENHNKNEEQGFSID